VPRGNADGNFASVGREQFFERSDVILVSHIKASLPVKIFMPDIFIEGLAAKGKF